MTNKKITFITLTGFQIGGSEDLWVRTAKLLCKQHQIVFFTNKFKQLPLKFKELKAEGAVHVDCIDYLANSFLAKQVNKIRMFFNKKFNWRYRKIAAGKPDKICINLAYQFLSVSHPDLTKMLNEIKVPYIIILQYCNEHPSLSDAHRKEVAEFYKNAENVFFVSKRNQLVIERILCERLPNAQIISNPVKTRNKVIIFPKISTIQFASIARLDIEHKAQDILMQILSGTNWQDRDWHLNVYGEGQDKNYLIQLTKFYGIQSKVTFHGQVEAIESVWQNNHILLLPSTAEGTPLTLLEAMACGRTAVVTDVGGNTEMMDSQIGYIADCFNFNSFGKAMEQAWLDKENWESNGVKAHELLKDRLIWASDQIIADALRK